MINYFRCLAVRRLFDLFFLFLRPPNIGLEPLSISGPGAGPSNGLGPLSISGPGPGPLSGPDPLNGLDPLSP